jgi:hypothetical protein
MPALRSCFTVTGRGGQAFTGAPPHQKPFFWLDNTGGVPASVLPGYGFNLFPQGSNFWIATSSGSLLLSCPFKLRAGKKLTVKATAITAHSFPYVDAAFALLLKNSQVQAVLFALRPDGVTHVGDLGGPGANFPPPSPGVTTTPVTGGPVKVVLGGIQYGNVIDAGDCSNNCSTQVTTAVVPGAGTYQLLFGMFVIGQPPDPLKPAALMIKSVHIA